MTAQELNRKAEAMIKGLSTEALLEYWMMTSTINDPGIPTVRGWIMDEIEARFPEQYDRWLESEDCTDEALVRAVREAL